ncbi:MAG: hypothetical protein IPK52_27370 [Chloroflexi bacterium]|nr:hypothetical protein [Chloroflexota bacterium]
MNLTNTATLFYTDGDDVPQTLEDTADINIVEPQVALEKAMGTATTTVEIGGIVTYTLTLEHTAQSTNQRLRSDRHRRAADRSRGGSRQLYDLDTAASTRDDGGRTATDSYTAPTITFTLSSLDMPDTCTYRLR